MRPSFLLLLLSLTAFLALPVHADDFKKLSKTIFVEIEAQLDKIEDSGGASAASSEIALARKWIEDGQRFLSEGSLKKAAVIAERLPTQLELVRALVAAGTLVSKADEMEKEIHTSSTELKALEARLSRLTLLYHGQRATHAVPSKKEATE